MTRKRSPAEAMDPNNQEYARQTYNDAWNTYLGVLSGTNPPADIAHSHEFFLETAPVFQHHKMAFEEARARIGIAVTAGLLGDAKQSCAAARTALKVLAPWLKPDERHEEKLASGVRALRVLSDAAPTVEERLKACGRGQRLLRALGPSPENRRLTALFHRAAGTAEARRRPKTTRTLARAEAHLLKAAALLETLPIDRTLLVSRAKTQRELARVLRTRKKLADAEKAVRQAVELNRGAGVESPWDRYHLAKVLRDRGDKAGALEECEYAKRRLEEPEPVDRDDHQVHAVSDINAIEALAAALRRG